MQIVKFWITLFSVLLMHLNGFAQTNTKSFKPDPTVPIPAGMPTRGGPSPEETALQQEISRALRLARQAESDNDWQRAIELWQFVWEKRPGDYSAYNGLRRAYIQLRRYDDALAFIDRAEKQNRASRSPLEPSVIAADRIEILFTAGRTDEAQTAIDRALAEFKGSPNIVRAISNVLFGQRRTDEAMSLLKRARKESGNPFLFAQEMAYQAEVRMDWATAVAEYINYIQEGPERLSYVTGVLGDICENPAADSIVQNITNQRLKEADNNFKPVLKRLQAGLHFRARRYAQALALYQELDQLGGEEGGELLRFAKLLAEEKEWNYGLEAYNSLLLRNPSQALRSKIQVGCGICLEALNQPDSALMVYRAALAPGIIAETAVVAYRRIADIELQLDYPPAEARKHYEEVLKIMRRNPSLASDMEDVQVQMALTYEREGDLTTAQAELEKIVRIAGNRVAAAPKARLELAKVHFRKGFPTKARYEAAALLSADPTSEYANDALLLMMLFDRLKDDSLTLTIFGEGDYLCFLKKFDDAATTLNKLISNKTTSPLTVEEALWRLSEINSTSQRYADALANLDDIISRPESSLRTDAALFAAGKLCLDKLDNPLAAARYLELLLTRCPDSPLVDAARRLLRSNLNPAS
ncbi:MAG: tetratricopeptide repeat protein [Calditrichaeota bacterium]|nr:tetratricopeptide repeat protein [Calditrichota bacterium]